MKKRRPLRRKSSGESQEEAERAATSILRIVEKGAAGANVEEQSVPVATGSRLYTKYQKSRRLAQMRRRGMKKGRMVFSLMATMEVT